jgi:hypothetical protein
LKTAEEWATEEAEHAARQRRNGIDHEYEEYIVQLKEDQASWHSFLDTF